MKNNYIYIQRTKILVSYLIQYSQNFDGIERNLFFTHMKLKEMKWKNDRGIVEVLGPH